MATQIKIEIIERHAVKPSSQTPHHLRNFKLSLLDQMSPAAYVPILLFYPSNAKSINERCEHLIQSFTKTLTHFYPLAGTITGNTVIECNDDGAVFMKARVSSSLSEILEHPDPDMLRRLVPAEFESTEAAGTGPLLLVQVNLFECGGMGIGLIISHKIADASTLCAFLNCWAATAHQSEKVILPQFGAVASLFPPLNFSNSEPPAKEVDRENCLSRRYVFDDSKIAILQSKVASSAVPKPTRVEAVLALIWKCAIEASSKSSSKNLGSSPNPIRPSLFRQAVNLRKTIVPPLPENLAGNLWALSTSKAEETTSVLNLKDLVAKLRGGVEEIKECAKKVALGPNVAFQVMTEYFSNLKKHDDIETFNCTSWCRFPFYETDLGWGKPSWVTFPGIARKNLITLIDKSDCEGIEACLSMTEESMAVFESNAELLAYASPNPKFTY